MLNDEFSSDKSLLFRGLLFLKTREQNVELNMGYCGCLKMGKSLC